ncbi:hypothetical protein VNO80_20426 [Phaseolus coccineus]|uniref:LHY n=1 Tax=Phaseolus coccineus TaxID=3886 RepID=A0AAN9R1K7_PHACN
MDAYSSGEEVVIKTRKPYTITKQRERWTEEEHNRFLEALKLYGRAWQRIEEHIGTKTAVQIRSHAQKFFSKLEKEAFVKGVPIGQALDIDIPPPRPKRKPSNPYPRKTNAGVPTLQNGAKNGKSLISVASLHGKQALDLEKEPLPEKHGVDLKENKDESSWKAFTILQEAPCSSVSLPLRNSCALRDFIPSIKEVITLDETNESFITDELQNHKLELDDGKHTQKTNDTCKVSKLENSGALKLVQTEKTDAPHCELTIDGMQGNQNYPRHVHVHVVDENFGTSNQNPSPDMFVQDSMFNGHPKILTNSAASNITESQNNTARSSIHQSCPPCPPFTQHNQDDYHSFLHMSSTFSNLIVSTLLQNPAAHAAASFAATFWPYANAETSADSPVCTQGFPSGRIGSPPTVTAITAATVAAATAWWAAHGLLPLCTPLHTAFAFPPASATAAPSMTIGESPHKNQQEEVKPQNPPLLDQILDPEQSEVLQGQHPASKSPAVSSSESQDKGDTNVNTASKATNPEMNQALSENPDSDKMNGRKPVDRSSCGSNTTSSSEETEIQEKDEKEKEDPNTPDASLLGTEPNNRRSRSISNLTESWKEVSEGGRLAFQALFSREVLPQSFSPPHALINADNQLHSIKNADYKDEDLETKKCSPNCDVLQKSLLFVKDNHEEEGFLTIGLGQGKLKSRRTGFKPYKRCSVEAKENMIGTACNQGEEKGPKRIRLNEEAST